MLGRWINHYVKDRDRAEGILILGVALTSILLIVGFYIGWVIVQPAAEADPTGATALAYFAAQLITVVVFLLVTVIGFKPALTVTVEDHSLLITQGKKKRHIALSVITSVSTITPLQFHRHYRKYRDTQSFFNKIEGDLLLLTTAEGPIVIGLNQQDLATLLSSLRSSASLERTDSVAYAV